jgi:tetratricopeptide (TPR) repeat protein
MSRQELADAVNAYLAGTNDPDGPVTANHVGKLEQGTNTWPRALRRQAYRMVLGATTDAELGFYNIRRRPTDEPPVASPPTAGQNGFTAPTGSSARDPSVGARYQLSELEVALTSLQAPDDRRYDRMLLPARVADVKRKYQQCRYRDAVSTLPTLVADLAAACQDSTGQARADLNVAAAATYQVAGSVLSKFGLSALALLAADRSMAAARASADPVAIASSARCLTHAMSRAGHHATATRIAADGAALLDKAVGLQDPAAVSVYGALLLRGAVAAARVEDRQSAYQMLAQAEEAADRLGQDANERWTSFGPTNVLLHRISVATSLGDAGQAVELSRQVDVRAVVTAERRASLFLDLAEAYTQRKKYEAALQSLVTAARHAAEEVRVKPSVRDLVVRIRQSAPPSVRSSTVQFSQQIGICT